jgi:hypothetical protein
MKGGGQRASCQSRRLASKDNKMLLMQTMEDSSLRLIADRRLSTCEVLPHCGGSRMRYSRSETGR